MLTLYKKIRAAFTQGNEPVANNNLPPVESNARYLLFIGSARSGTTMLGQLLNNHPNCLVSNEERVLQGIVESDWQKTSAIDLRNQLAENIIPQAHRLFLKGVEQNSRFSETLELYQKQWKSFDGLADRFSKGDILVFGDKKAGGHSALYSQDPESFTKLMSHIHPLKIVQLVRNPVNTVSSMCRSHGFTLEKSIEVVCSSTLSGVLLREQLPEHSQVVYYEDLQESPQQTLTELLAFLELPLPSGWIEAASSIISTGGAYNVEEQVVDKVKRAIKADSRLAIFNRYFTD